MLQVIEAVGRFLIIFAVVEITQSQSIPPKWPQQFFPYQEQPEEILKSETFFYFDTDILKAISDGNNGNILISPFSIKNTLAMILEGAENKTAKELRNALRLENDKTQIRKEFQKLLETLQNHQPGVVMNIANHVFLANGLTPVIGYRNIQKYYQSNITNVDFNLPSGADIINNWVYEQTNGVIPSLVDPSSFGGDVSIVLANALYFKGTWLKEFSRSETTTTCFYKANGECFSTPMMELVETFKYDDVRNLDAKVLELPYSGGEYSMVVVLPNKRDGVKQLARNIRTSINQIVQQLNETELLVLLPRFQIQYNTDLIHYLPKVHIEEMFSPRAVLTGITAELGVRVSNVLHKATIEVNEEGSIAAAATGSVVIPLMGNTKPRFRADHPFLFYIRHIPTGTILFEGRVSEPERAAETFERPTERTSSNQRPPRPDQTRLAATNTKQQQAGGIATSFPSRIQPPQQTQQQQPQTRIQTTQRIDQIYYVQPPQQQQQYVLSQQQQQEQQQQEQQQQYYQALRQQQQQQRYPAQRYSVQANTDATILNKNSLKDIMYH